MVVALALHSFHIFKAEYLYTKPLEGHKKDYFMFSVLTTKLNLLIDHISITYNTLKIQHPEAEIIICGDKNNLDEKKIISLDHNFRQVTTPGKTSGCIQLSQTYAAIITHQL